MWGHPCSGGLQARTPDQAHLNGYYLVFTQNLAQVTILKHFPKIESMIFTPSFYLLMWHFYRLEKKAIKFVWHDLHHIKSCYLLTVSLSSDYKEFFLMLHPWLAWEVTSILSFWKR